MALDLQWSSVTEKVMAEGGQGHQSKAEKYLREHRIQELLQVLQHVPSDLGSYHFLMGEMVCLLRGGDSFPWAALREVKFYQGAYEVS